MNDEPKRRFFNKQVNRRDVLDPTYFVSRNNYFLICFFDKVFRIIWLLSKKFGFINNQTGRRKRVVFIGPTHLGDVLLTTPAIRFAKEKNPTLEIICIVSISSKSVIENNPYLAGVEIIDLPWFLENEENFIQTILSFFKFIKVLKVINAETAFNFSSTSYHREHLAMWLAGIPNRIGFSHKGFGFFLTGGPSFLPNELIARQKLRMVGDWLGENTDHYSLKPDYFVCQTAERRADDLMTPLGFRLNKAVIGINPGAQHNYLWPESHWVELCNFIFNKWRPNVVFLGSRDFEKATERIRSQLNFESFSLAGMTSVAELAAILKRLDLLITIDTGTRHIANAVGTKAIVLRNGANSIYEFGKYVEPEHLIIHTVPCSPCGREICPLGTLDCMSGIGPETVMCAVENVLGNYVMIRNTRSGKVLFI